MLYCSCSLRGYSCYSVTYINDYSSIVNRLRPFNLEYGDLSYYYQQYSRVAGSLFVSKTNSKSYYADLQPELLVNFQSLCVGSDVSTDRFLLYDSNRVKIVYDTCLKEFNSVSSSSAKLFEYTIYGSIKYIDYTNTTNSGNDPSPISECYGSNRYVLIIKLLPENYDSAFDDGKGVKRLTCSDRIIRVATSNIPLVEDEDDSYDDYEHLMFSDFVVQNNTSPFKFSSVSRNTLKGATGEKPSILHHCYIDSETGVTKIPVNFVLLEQFSIRPDGFVTITNVSSIIYYGYVAVSVDVEHILHCFITR